MNTIARTGCLAACLLVLSGPVKADLIEVHRSSRGTVFIDTATIQRSSEFLRYSSVTREPRWHTKADVLVDCVGRRRKAYGTDQAMYTVYASTAEGDEVAAACDYAERVGVLPAELARARPEPPTPRVAAVPVPAPLPVPPKTEPAPSSPPTVRVERRMKSAGSGFFVTQGFVVTNFHVVRGCNGYAVRRDRDTFEARLGATSERSDLALLVVPAAGVVPPSLRSSASLGEDVMVAGHPLSGLLGEDLVVASGQVNSLAGLGNDPTRMQISAPVQPGNSGGPVVDRFGSVVGVVVSKLDVLKVAPVIGDVSQNVNFAIKAEMLRLFLDTNRVGYVGAVQGRRLEGSELAERARGFTVQVLCSE